MTIKDRIPLADAIASLRAEISEAHKRALALTPDQRYKITEVALELSVVAEDSAHVSGEVGWWVLKAGASAEAKSTASQKVFLKLDVGQVLVNSTRQAD